jgi:hypothetical protein
VSGPAGLRRFVDDGARPDASGPAAPGFVPPPTIPAGQPVTARAGERISQPPDQERCELCAVGVPAGHGHVADTEGAALLCACRACYLLFTQEAAGRRYRAVPDRYLVDTSRVMPASAWEQLQIPVGLAFFIKTSRSGGELSGLYPSPAGVTECQLDLSRWQRLVEEYPLLDAPETDVEAALISQSDDGVEYYLVPVDACYELAGRMRLYWHGFDGGTEARQSIASFLTTVRSLARPFAAG